MGGGEVEAEEDRSNVERSKSQRGEVFPVCRSLAGRRLRGSVKGEGRERNWASEA